ncbi:MAG: RNA polymerase sigma factor [Deltaproteobacteria bacterium]|nr:RNA polymerase sigma factor [Deltaproteobacteria bacterium]
MKRREDEAMVADQRLAEAIGEGDEAAIRRLYELHAASLTRRLFHALGDAEAARDLTQDAFVTALAKMHRFRGEASLSTWLHGIAFNHLRDHRKHTRRRRWWGGRRPDESAAPEPSPDAVASSRQDLRRLHSAIEQLRPKLRDAYALRVIEQLSLREAAAILGAREATVSDRTKRAEAIVKAAFETPESDS